MSIKNYIIGGFLVVFSNTLFAQNTMRIHLKDRAEQDIPISQIDSVTFVDKNAPEEELTLMGSWMWGNKNAGYYELITFNDDYTYTGYDNYFSIGLDTWTYGWYSQLGFMLTLQSNGYGYNRRYNWYLAGLSKNAMEVITKMGGYIYYRLQQETIHVSLSEPFYFATDDTVVFSDDVYVRGIENKLSGITKGTSYVLVRVALSDEIVAHKIIIE